MRVSAVFAATASGLDKVQVDPHTGLFRDSFGRARIFHGVNAVFKAHPWLPARDSFDPANSIVEQDMQDLKKWGFNMVRLGVMWPGVELSDGSVNTTYMQEVTSLANDLADHGVYTLVDLHQDLLSRRFCGEGVPEHYVDDLLKNASSDLAKAKGFPVPAKSQPFPVDAEGNPDLDTCLKNQFATYYLSNQVGLLFRELYTPGTALNEGFLRYWDTIAKEFANKAPHVLGYELINEPSGECLDGNLKTCAHVPIFDNNFETQYLAPMYKAAADRIRQSDKDRPIFFEATPLPILGSTPPFKAPPLGDDPQQVFAYHVYCAPGDGKDAGTAAVCHATQDVFTHEYFSFLNKYSKLGGFMTEFGAIGNNANQIKHMERLMNTADSKFQSWAYWSFKNFNDITTAEHADPLYDTDGSLETAKVKSLARTYAQAVAGTPTTMTFNADTSLFQLQYTATVTEAPTEIYYSKEFYYPSGYSLTVDPESCVTQNATDTTIFLHTAPSCVGKKVSVTLKRSGAQLADVLV
mmetsp:Transcript_90663/g.207469  ORF Transcript_90663/g.207469 Transcript_90663/m.207469 type:complete len:522 (+) Transcript_90663:49-1614(+)